MTHLIDATEVKDGTFTTRFRGSKNMLTISQHDRTDDSRATVILDRPELVALVDRLVAMGLVTRVTTEEQEARLIAQGGHTQLPQDPDLLDRIDR